jgi:hypothetical protein
VRPYYEDESVVVYCGNWQDIPPTALAGVGAVVTDPPYGIGADRNQANRANKQHGAALAPSRDYGESDWDHQPPSADDISSLLSIGTHHIFWGGNYFALPPSAAWLVWDKDNGNNGYADCELAWSDLRQAARRFRYRWMGMLQELPEDRYHPTQKPLALMRWTLGFLPEPTTVFDPYMGSGTTLRAANDLGMKAIGCEREERYCAVAVERLAQYALDLGEAA